MAMPTMYARPAYLLFAGHALQAGLASAHTIREAVWQSQSTCTDFVRVYCCKCGIDVADCPSLRKSMVRTTLRPGLYRGSLQAFAASA